MLGACYPARNLKKKCNLMRLGEYFDQILYQNEKYPIFAIENVLSC